MGKETLKLSQAALRFVDDKCSASVKFAEGSDKPQLQMTAYSGGIISNHWYWGDLAIDLEGMSFPKKKFPILEDHRTDMKIGFATKFSIDNNQLTVLAAEFVDTPESIKFRETSAQGFPYEASIYAKPSKIQRLMENETATVNGFEMKGPGTIWRKSCFKEASVCTFGYDPNTNSAAMSESNEEITVEHFNEQGSSQIKTQEETNGMNALEKFKSEHPEDFKSLVAEVTATVTTQFAATQKDLETKLAATTEENSKLSEENKSNEKRLLTLEKSALVFTEKEIQRTADSIFAEKFKAADLPDRLSAKIRKLVAHDKFVSDNTLDTEKFAAAVDAELKDWSSSEEEGSILGFSASSKDHNTDQSATKFSKDCEDAAARMLKVANGAKA